MILLIICLFIFIPLVIFYIYDNFLFKKTSDDWFEELMFYSITQKTGRRHPGFVRKNIKISKDKYYISYDKNGDPIRKAKYEQV